MASTARKPNLPSRGSRKRPPAAPATPHLGLVCITSDDRVRYRTITRTRFLSFDEPRQIAALDDLYRANVRTLFAAVDFCHAEGIRLYRVTSNLFPQVDHPIGRRVLDTLVNEMAGFGEHANRRGVRVVIHPDQFVVLNSETPRVVEQSVAIMADHALVFDRLGLPRTSWSMMLLHGGKGGRPGELVEAIARLPANIRGRLALENDERAYGAAAILDICRAAGVPMVFDAHHHVVKERLDTYDHPDVARFTDAAAATWPDPAWQIVHISNGLGAFGDSRHSDLITAFPSAFRRAPWVEVEAKLKEQAIARLGRLLAGRVG